jgi:hypothetical protein
MKWLICFFLPFLCGCSILRVLDFGGDDKKPFEFRFGWEKGVDVSIASPGKTDCNGVYQPEVPEVDAALSFPDVSAGMMVEIQPHARITPVVNVDAFDVKLPYLRWFSFQGGMGYQLAEAYVGKRIISVLELTAGGWFGYDFNEHAWAWGLGGTIIKF